MMKPKLLLPMVMIGLAPVAVTARADYRLELKNGRSITVPSYREEAGMIKFSGFGGEIGIARDQIQMIRQPAAANSNNLNVTRTTATQAGSPAVRPTTDSAKDRAAVEATERAKEEAAYQDKVRALTEQLKSAREQYSQAVRGATGPQGTQLHTEEQLRARADDANARFKNAQHNPSQPEPVKLLVPSPFSSVPLQAESFTPAPFPAAQPGAPVYSGKEGEFSRLRENSLQIEREREKLINEMRQKGFNTGALFTE